MSACTRGSSWTLAVWRLGCYFAPNKKIDVLHEDLCFLYDLYVCYMYRVTYMMAFPRRGCLGWALHLPSRLFQQAEMQHNMVTATC